MRDRTRRWGERSRSARGGGPQADAAILVVDATTGEFEAGTAVCAGGGGRCAESVVDRDPSMGRLC